MSVVTPPDPAAVRRWLASQGRLAGGSGGGGASWGHSLTPAQWEQIQSSAARYQEQQQRLNERLYGQESWNLGTALLNLISADNYAIAGATNWLVRTIGDTVDLIDGDGRISDRNRARFEALRPSLERGDIFGTIGAAMDWDWQDQLEHGGALPGLMTGLGIDVGQRDSPLWGDNLRDWGVNDENFKGGDALAATLGGALDIFASPLTYATLGIGAGIKGAARGLGAAAKATQQGQKLTGIRYNPFAERQIQLPLMRPNYIQFLPETTAAPFTAIGNQLRGIRLGARSGVRLHRAEREYLRTERALNRAARRGEPVRGAGVLPGVRNPAEAAAVAQRAARARAEAAAGAAAAQAGVKDFLTRANESIEDATAAAPIRQSNSAIYAQFGSIPETVTSKSINDLVREQIVSATTRSERGLKKALRTQPFNPSAVAKAVPDIRALRETGGAESWAGLVNAYRASKTERGLSRAAAPYADQIATVAKHSIPAASLSRGLLRALQSFRPRAGDAVPATADQITGGQLLDFLYRVRKAGAANSREASSLAGRADLDKAAAEARRLIDRIVDEAVPTPKAVAAATKEEWIQRLVDALGRSRPGVREFAEKAARLRDPDKLHEAIQQFAANTAKRERKFDGFTDLMNWLDKKQAALAARELGQDSAAGIREILKSLGITPRGGMVSMVGLLKKHGRVKLSELEEARKATLQLLDDAQVPGGSIINDAAKVFDIEAAAIGAARDFDAAASALREGEDLTDIADRALADALGETITRFRDSFKQAADEVPGAASGVTKLGEVWARNRDGKSIVGSWNDLSDLKAWTTARDSLSKLADSKGITGPARADYIYNGMRRILHYKDAWLKKNGVQPIARWTQGKRREWVYLSNADVLDALPPDLAKALFFTGKDVSLPPSAIHAFARAALKRPLNTQSLDEYAAALRDQLESSIRTIESKYPSGRGGFLAREPEKAREAIDAAVRAMMAPGTVEALTKRHIQNGTYAVAAMKMVSDEVTGHAREALIRILDSAADWGAKVAAITKVPERINSALRQANLMEAADGQIAKMSRQEIDLALSQHLSEGEFFAYRAARRALEASRIMDDGAKASDEYMAKVRAETTAAAARTGRTGEHIPPPRRGAESPRQRLERHNQNRARKQDILDNQEIVDDIVTRIMADMPEELLDDGMLAALTADVGHTFARAGRFSGQLFDRLSPTHEQQATRILATLTEGSSRWQINLFDRELGPIARRNSAEAIAAGFKGLQGLSDESLDLLNEVNIRLHEVTRRGGDPAEVLDSARRIFDAAGVSLSDDAIRAAVDLVPPLKIVFGGGAEGLIPRIGIDPKYLNKHMVPTGVAAAERGGFLFPENAAASDIYNAWREFNPPDALDFLRRVHAGLQNATVPATIAADFSAKFGHSALGITPEVARGMGWKKVDIDAFESHDLLRFLDPDEYFDPQFIAQLRKTGEYLNMPRTPEGKGLLERWLVKMDPIISTLKAGLTLWRPGHWVTSTVGEVWMNLMAGVTNPKHYWDAVRILYNAGRIGPPDGSFRVYYARTARDIPQTFDEAAKHVMIPIQGKNYPVTYETIMAGAEKRGIPLRHMTANEDILTDEVSERFLGLGGAGRSGPIKNATHTLGRFAAARDSAIRMAHFLSELQKVGGRTLDEMMDAAAKKVHDFHPSVYTLSGWERSHARRIIYFYTWQKQAFVRIMEVLMESPGRVAIPSKLSYNMAIAGGLDPESVGNPVDENLELPSYMENSPYGTQFLWGLAPFTEGRMAWGFSLNSPAQDLFGDIFGAITYDPRLDLGQNAWNIVTGAAQGQLADKLSPAINIPYRLINRQDSFGNRIEGPAGTAQFLIDQTGLQYPSRLTGQLFPGVPRSDVKDDPREQAGNQARLLLNWLTGSKFTNYSAPNIQEAARRENREIMRKMLGLD